MSSTRELLVKKIEDEAVKRARKQCSSGCPYTDKCEIEKLVKQNIILRKAIYDYRNDLNFK